MMEELENKSNVLQSHEWNVIRDILDAPQCEHE